MTIKGIVFDKDGTLVDFHATWFAIGDRLALEAAGGDRTRADELVSEAGYDFASARFRADSVFAAGTNADIVALWYAGQPAETKRAMIRHFDEVTAREGALQATPVVGTREALAELHAHGYKLAVATNDSTAGAEQTLVALGVAQMFVAAYGYDAVANPKPAPDVIHAFCDLTGLRPGEVAMVGDNRHDLETARAAGALAVGVLSGTGTRETLASRADHILDSVADLPGLLARRDC
ncbi:HAD family hydrolase [Mesorhizobium xinjiangense]|uniref:HAD family hydrolase n=1 Tax=Mesorhizobium xinjiangense TaxID=2678685 RepID=UPI001F1A0536|nr:HAD family hydrolase [Mesorhizobium xinjiangense]